MARIPLDDPRWTEFLGGYRTPEDFPTLLRQLEDDPQPGSDLWDALHHQGDVDVGSYASLPYLLDAAEATPAAERLEMIALVAIILALSEAERNPRPPADIKDQMQDDRQRLGTLALEALALTSDGEETDVALLLGAVAVAQGHARLGHVFLDWNAEYMCPRCFEIVPPMGYDL